MQEGYNGVDVNVLLDLEYKRLHDLIEVRQKAMKEQAKYLSQVNMGHLQSAFEDAVAFLTGAVKYILVKHYGCPELYDFADYEKELLSVDDRYGRPHFEAFKLITLYGMTEGDFKWRLNRYSDGSGGGTDLTFFTDLETAREALCAGVEASDKDYYSDTALEQMEKWGLTPDPVKLTARAERMKSSLREEERKEQERRQINVVKLSEFIKKWLTPR